MFVVKQFVEEKKIYHKIVKIIYSFVNVFPWKLFAIYLEKIFRTEYNVHSLTLFLG